MRIIISAQTAQLTETKAARTMMTKVDPSVIAVDVRSESGVRNVSSVELCDREEIDGGDEEAEPGGESDGV